MESLLPLKILYNSLQSTRKAFYKCDYGDLCLFSAFVRAGTDVGQPIGVKMVLSSRSCAGHWSFFTSNSSNSNHVFIVVVMCIGAQTYWDWNMPSKTDATML